MFKEITIENRNLYVLLDTGSHLSLMRKDIFMSISASKLCESEILLTGIAQSQVRTLGHHPSNDGYNRQSSFLLHSFTLILFT